MHISVRIPRSVFALIAVAAVTIGGLTAAGAMTGEPAPPRPPAGAELRSAGDAPTPSPAELYTGIRPCRLLDTRQTSPLAANTRAFRASGNLTSQGGLANCGIPTYATSVAINLTGISTGSSGFIRGWAASTAPPTATLLNFATSINASNQVNIPLCTGACTAGDFNLRAFGSSVNVVGDAVGYYAPPVHGRINAAGVLQPGSAGITYVFPTGPGTYDIGVDRDPTNCAVSLTNEDPQHNVDVSGYAFGGADVFVSARDDTNALRSTGFTIALIC